MSVSMVVETYGPDAKYAIVTQTDDCGAIEQFYFVIDASLKHGWVRVKPMVGLLSAYFLIAEDGRVFSLRSRKEIRTNTGGTGYTNFSTRLEGRSGKAIAIKVHRQVAFAFIPNPDMKPFVNHKDGIKTNPHYSNLEWCTHQENVDHAVETGLIATGAAAVTGTAHPHAVLTQEQVDGIKLLRGTMSQKKIGRLFNVGRSTIQVVLAGKRYA